MYDKKAGVRRSGNRITAAVFFITIALSFLAGRYEFPRHEESANPPTATVAQVANLQAVAKAPLTSRPAPAPAQKKMLFKRKVEHGETWSQIAAREFYGGWRPEVYTELAKATGIKDPGVIYAGTIVAMPCVITVGGRSLHARNCAEKASTKKLPRRSLRTYVQKNKPARSDRPYSTVLDNNPLNVTYGPSTSHWVTEGYATVKHHKGLPYLAFQKLEIGTRAASELLFTSRLYGTMTVAQAITTWSGHNYGNEILRGTTINSRARVKDLGSTERSMLLYVMARREGGKLIRSP